MYRLSFTAAGFRLAETTRLAETYAELGDWSAVRAAVFTGDLLQKGKRQTIKSEYRELELRLHTLSEQEIRYFLETDAVTRRQLLLIAICRTYEFVRQFVIDVVRVNYQRFEVAITDSDYLRFFVMQSALHEKLDQLSASSKVKIRQVLFQMLAGGGYIVSTQQRIITPPVVLPTLTELLRQERPDDLPLLIFNDRDL